MAGTYSDALGGILPGTTGNLDPTSAARPAGSAGLAVGTGTGQHGFIPLVSSLGAGVGNAWSELLDWINEPFTQPMTPGSLTIIVGTILVAVMFWNFILYHVRIAAEEI